MYRAVTLCGLRRGVIGDGHVDEQALVGMLPDVRIAFEFNPRRGASDVFLDGENVEKEIRGIEVSDHVSLVSRIGAVREQLVAMQRRMGADRGVVMDGRDIGTVVFPDAELKIFMTADPEIRALRRYRELEAKGEKVSLDEIRRNLSERDRADRTRPIGPLRQAEDAVVLDNSRMTLEEELRWAETLICERIERSCTSK